MMGEYKIELETNIYANNGGQKKHKRYLRRRNRSIDRAVAEAA